MNVNIYTNYFRQKAIAHPLLMHDIAAESADGEIGKRRFTTFNMQQVANGLRSAISDNPFFHLHIYDIRLKDNGSAIKGDYTGGFLITMKANKDVLNEIETAYNTCESIALDIIGDMRMEFLADPNKCDFPFGEIYWSQATINAAGPIFTERYGWWVEFPFDVKMNSRLSKQQIDFNFNRN